MKQTKYLLPLNYIKTCLSNSYLPSLDNYLIHFDGQSDQLDKEDLTIWYNQIVNFELLNDLTQKNFNEISIHKGHLVFYKQQQNLYTFHLLYSPDDIQLMFEIIAYKQHINWNLSNPFASFKLTLVLKNLRCSLFHHSICADGRSRLFIRHLNYKSIDLENFGLDYRQQQWLLSQVESKKNILISGATYSGKTTLLQKLIENIAPTEHLAILEDTYELQCQQEQVTHLLASESIHSQKSLGDFLPYILRASPDRIILGELRSSEIIPFVLAMNSGHAGLMATVHANNAVDACHRLNTLFSIYAHQFQLSQEHTGQIIAKGIDLIIHLDQRSVAQIIELKGHHRGQYLYEQRE
jgi:Flp pilus assembly CpaF family ATPase